MLELSLSEPCMLLRELALNLNLKLQGAVASFEFNGAVRRYFLQCSAECSILLAGTRKKVTSASSDQRPLTGDVP